MESTRKLSLIVCVCLACVSGTPGVASAQDEGGPPRTNLQKFQELAARIGASAGAAIADTDSTTMTIAVLPKETGWCIEEAIARSMLRSRMRRIESPAAAYRAEFGINEMRVAYANMRQDGLFGRRVVDRTISLELFTKVVDQRSGQIVRSTAVREVGRDTVGVTEVERLENPTIPQTKGSLPPEGLFSTFLEPIIVLGTIAVAIVLLFTVRS